ncbi:WAT1-related protein [Canna indica]|uniref:WAT1-related protein n=1 Tax=Canna indica TaxID=4628 RepID=A0AAQ3KS80_9LILI|nr:WAT1-related protein [Canna indica]
MDAKKPYIAAILIQMVYTGYYVISKAAFDKGMSTYVFIFYRQAAASVLLMPIAFILERKSPPPLTFMVFLKLFFLALLGLTLSLNLYNIGLKDTSASVASAATNSIPVFTFFFAIFFRMESIKLKRISGVAKTIGVALCLAGVITIAFYQGPHVHPLDLHGHFGNSSNNQNHASTPSRVAWIKGSFFMILANMAWSMWLVLQGILLKEYPSKLLFTTLQCVFSTFQSLLVAMAFERDRSKWQLHFDMGLLAILYCGFIITGISFYLQSWCIEKKGPVFIAIFTPLSLVFTMICSTIFLGEMIYLGSILGGILMVGGLYGVLWGKSKESIPSEVTIEDGKTHMQEKQNEQNHCDAIVI